MKSKDRLDKSALSFSGGQQQRLCIARALAVQPEVFVNGRAYFGTGPDFDPEDRRFGIGIEAKLYYRHGNA